DRQGDCPGERPLPLPVLRAPRAGHDAWLVRDLSRLLLGGRRRPVPLAHHGRRSEQSLPDRGPAQLPGLRRLRPTRPAVRPPSGRGRAARPRLAPHRPETGLLRGLGGRGPRPVARRPLRALLVAPHFLAPGLLPVMTSHIETLVQQLDGKADKSYDARA